MTTTPTLDIIIPVWNNPTESRACLVSVLESAPEARLIIVNNGCDRTTELMLEEFSDHLGDRAIYMTMERNIGFVPAVNRALARSDADWAMVVRPTVTITAEYITQLTDATSLERAGIITPHCTPEHEPIKKLHKYGCNRLETNEISFSTIAISRAARDAIGCFDDTLDGGIWCLRDFRHRANAHGFRTWLLPNVSISGARITRFGSAERQRQQDAEAAACFSQRWGSQQYLAVYLPKSASDEQLSALLQLLLRAARNGHRFELLLHRRQYLSAQQQGAGCLHHDIHLHKLSLLTPIRSLSAKLQQIKTGQGSLPLVCGLDGTAIPGYDDALPVSTIEKLTQPCGG